MLLLLLALATLTADQSAAAQAPPIPAASVDVKEKKICRMENPIVGTRIGGRKRICRTEREWTRREEESQQLMRRVDEAGAAEICQGNGGDCGGGQPGTGGDPQ